MKPTINVEVTKNFGYYSGFSDWSRRQTSSNVVDYGLGILNASYTDTTSEYGYKNSKISTIETLENYSRINIRIKANFVNTSYGSTNNIGPNIAYTSRNGDKYNANLPVIDIFTDASFGKDVFKYDIDIHMNIPHKTGILNGIPYKIVPTATDGLTKPVLYMGDKRFEYSYSTNKTITEVATNKIQFDADMTFDALRFCLFDADNSYTFLVIFEEPITVNKGKILDLNQLKINWSPVIK